MIRFAYPLAFLAAILACQGGAGSREREEARATAGDQHQTDVGAEDQALRSLRQAHSDAIAAKNADSVVTIYAEDVLYLPQGDKPETGRHAARDAWGRGFKADGLRLEYRPEEFKVAASGDLAFERGKVWSSEKPGSELREGGNYVYLWKKEGGQWKVGIWMWNWYEQS